MKTNLHKPNHVNHAFFSDHFFLDSLNFTPILCAYKLPIRVHWISSRYFLQYIPERLKNIVPTKYVNKKFPSWYYKNLFFTRRVCEAIELMSWGKVRVIASVHLAILDMFEWKAKSWTEIGFSNGNSHVDPTRGYEYSEFSSSGPWPERFPQDSSFLAYAYTTERPEGVTFSHFQCSSVYSCTLLYTPRTHFRVHVLGCAYVTLSTKNL